MHVNSLLPIGSVVLLCGGHKKLMIIGFLQGVQSGDERKQYDYIGVLFPEGFISVDSLILFNHDQIDSVAFTGCDDEERRIFIERVSEIVSFIDNSKSTKSVNTNKEAE